MTRKELEALGENPTVYFCSYDIGDEEAYIYTISNITTHGQYPEVGGYFKDGNYDEFWYDNLYATKEEAINSIFDNDIKITLDDDEVLRYSKDELEQMAYEELSGDYHDYDDKQTINQI